MPIYAINYTLNKKPIENYTTLAGAIQGASDGNYLRCLDSFWIISSTASAQNIYQHLSRFLKTDDSLVVHEMTKNYVCFLSKDKLDWIKKILG